MFDPDDFYTSKIFDNETLDQAKLDPHIREGMLVRVYSTDAPRQFIGIGRVLTGSMNWDDSFFYQYLVDIELQDRKIYYGVPIGFLEREICPGTVARAP